jgi:uncharacterized membrane protein
MPKEQKTITEKKEISINRTRHMLKAITWRIIASATTFGLSMLFFRDDPLAWQKSTGIAIAESFIKMILYYYHERAWYHVNFGIRHKRRLVKGRRNARRFRDFIIFKKRK